MRSRSFGLTALILFHSFAVAGLVGCAVNDGGVGRLRNYSATPRVEHVVVCWLKNHGNDADQRRLVAASYDFLGKIDGLVDVRAGKVLPSTRPATDSSFDVAIVMTFADEASVARYGQSPVHQQAVHDVLKPLVDHYVVYDFAADEMRRKR